MPDKVITAITARVSACTAGAPTLRYGASPHQIGSACSGSPKASSTAQAA